MVSRPKREPSLPVHSSEQAAIALALTGLVTLLALVFLGPASGEEVVFQGTLGYGGLTHDVKVDHDHAYAVTSSGMLVLNLSGSKPLQEAFIPLKGTSFSVAVSGGRAYVGNSRGLVIIDVNQPDRPTVLAHTGYRVDTDGATLSDGLGYFPDLVEGVRILDLEGRGVPDQIGALEGLSAAGLAHSGNYLYLLERGSGIKVYALDQPTRPLEVAHLNLTGSLRSLTLGGTWLYVAAEAEGVYVLDVSDPRDPQLRSTLDTREAREVVVIGDLAYVADGASLRLFQVQDPGAPQAMGVVKQEDMRVTGLAYYPDLVLAVEPTRGLRFIETSHPQTPTETDQYQSLADPRDLFLAGDRAYLVDQKAGLVILDLESPGGPQELGRYPSPQPLSRVVVQDRLALVLETHASNTNKGGAGDLRLIDLSEVARPKAGALFPAQAYDLLYHEGFAYLADREGLRVVNLSDLGSPVQETFVATSDYASALVIGLDHLFLSDLSGNLQVLSLENPGHPELEFTAPLGCPARDMAYEHGFLYLAEKGSGVCILEVTNPAQPRMIRYQQLPSAESLALEEGRLLVGASEYGMWLLNVSQPLSPTLMGFNATPGINQAVALREGELLFVDNAVGLGIQQVNFRPLAAILAPSSDRYQEGQPVQFQGTGHDPDGTVLSFLWTSDLQGVLSQADHFSSSTLTPGHHIITFKVLDDQGIASQPVVMELVIEAKPTLSNGTITPVKGQENSTLFHFQVDYSGPPEIVEPATWLEVTGLGSYPMEIVPGRAGYTFSTTLPAGDWAYSFSVSVGSAGSDLLAGSPSSVKVNARPLASVLTDVPVQHPQGRSYILQGYGQDRDGVVVEYLWQTSRGEVLGRERELDLAGLPTGEYTLGFYVLDDAGNWSEPVLLQGFEVISAPPPKTPLIPEPVKLGGGLVTVAAVASLTYGWFIVGESFRYRWWFMLAPLMVHQKDEHYANNPLANEIRGLIRGYLLAHPGVHYCFLKEELGLVNGTLAYHLQVLEREGLVESEKVGRRRLFYAIGKGVQRPERPVKSRPQRFAPWTGHGWGQHAHGHNARQEADKDRADEGDPKGPRTINARPVDRVKLLKLIVKDPGISQSDLAKTFGVSSAAIKYHIDQYIIEGLVRRERHGMRVAYFPQATHSDQPAGRDQGSS